MPFPQADVFASTLSHDQIYDERRARPMSVHPLSSIKLNSAQFFFVAFILFLATGVQAYFSRSSTSTTLSPLFNASTSLEMTQSLNVAINEFLSPLMLLACGVTMAGTLVRGLELVIQAAAFRGKA